MIRFAHGAATDVGRVRSLNEDSMLVAESLFAVADGMGGHRGGEVASAEALDVLRTSVLEPDAAAVLDAVDSANRRVFEHSVADPDLAGMGTTLCTVALVRDDDGTESIAIANVGDSRVYLLRDGAFSQITLDHSLVETMVRSGQLTPEEAAVHPGRNVLTRALGIEPEVEVDLFSEPVRDGDRYLLCSDGLFNELDDARIAEILASLAAPWDAASELVRTAVESGGRDNVTVVVVDVIDDDHHGEVDGLIGLGRDRAVRDDPGAPALPATQQLPVARAADGLPSEDESPEDAPSDDEPTGGAVDTPVGEATLSDEPGDHPASPRSGRNWRVWASLAVLIVVAGVIIGAALASRDSGSPHPATTTSTSTTTESTTSSSAPSTEPTTVTTAPAATTPSPTPDQTPAAQAPSGQ